MKVTALSSARWALFRLSKQHISQALARDGHEVLYVDPPLSFASVLRNRDRIADLRLPTDEEPEQGLHLWRPRVLPGQNSLVGQELNARLLRRGLRRRQPAPDVTVAFSLEARRLLSMAPGKRVYYCTDSFEDQPHKDREATRRLEQELIEAADLVVACSLPLCEQLRVRGADPLYLPHAVEDESLREPGPVPSVVRDLPRPLVGWAGTFNWRVDLSLLEAARRAAPRGTLLAIGGGYTAGAPAAVRSFLRSSGVVSVGEVPGEELPNHLAALDVALVPYTPEPFNRKSFPIKVLQYLAAGVPVVSSRNGATDELGAAVLVADEAKAFEAAVRAALQDRSVAADAERRSVGRSRRWVDNARALLSAAMSEAR